QPTAVARVNNPMRPIRPRDFVTDDFMSKFSVNVDQGRLHWFPTSTKPAPCDCQMTRWHITQIRYLPPSSQTFTKAGHVRKKIVQQNKRYLISSHQRDKITENQRDSNTWKGGKTQKSAKSWLR